MLKLLNVSALAISIASLVTCEARGNLRKLQKASANILTKDENLVELLQELISEDFSESQSEDPATRDHDEIPVLRISGSSSDSEDVGPMTQSDPNDPYAEIPVFDPDAIGNIMGTAGMPGSMTDTVPTKDGVPNHYFIGHDIIGMENIDGVEGVLSVSRMEGSDEGSDEEPDEGYKYTPDSDESPDEDYNYKPDSEESPDEDYNYTPDSDESPDEDYNYTPDSDESPDEDYNYTPDSDESPDEDYNYTPDSEEEPDRL